MPPVQLRRGLARALLPGAHARHVEPSALFSADDDRGPSERLIALAADSIDRAREISLESLRGRVKAGPYYPGVWPGEHYRLLTGMVAALQPRCVIEIGTATGLSALALLERLPAGSRLATFDLFSWSEDSETALTDDDFADGRLVQHLDDLSTAEGLRKHRKLLEDADLIFVDAAKDGEQESRFLANFEAVDFSRPPIVVFDDIRLWNMLRIWRGIDRPKLDLTSFGHWTGTGLVDWVAAPAR
jgi:predicted O-methyltransferase YrrM